MLVFTLKGKLIFDGTQFVNLRRQNINTIRSHIIPKIIDDDYLTGFGYKLNVKSTIFKDAKSSDLVKGFNLIVDSIKYQDIFDSFFELEVHNYDRFSNRLDAYVFPSLEFLKLCYWFYICSTIQDSSSKLLQIKREIHGKSKVINEPSRASQSDELREDLLNCTSDFYGEMMFASLSHTNGYDITLNKSNDFIIKNNVAEVKSIHDKFDKEILDQDRRPLLTTSLPDNFAYSEVINLICDQIMREKWKCHLISALRKRPKIILFNVAQMQELRHATMFMEQQELKKSFNNILVRPLSLINNQDFIPVLVALENIYQYHVISFFHFLAPVIYSNGNPELDLSRYSMDYFRDNIGLEGIML